MQQQAEFIQKFWKEQIKVSARYFSKKRYRYNTFLRNVSRYDTYTQKCI